MDNRKDAKIGSGWLAGTGSGFRQEPEFGKLAGNQEPAGFGATGPSGAPVQVWRRFSGNNSRILLPLTTLVHFPLRVSRARWCVLSLVAFRLEIAFRELVILLVSVIRLVRDGSKAERRARLPEERDAINSG